MNEQDRHATMIESLISTWVLVFQRCQDGRVECSPSERELLRRALRSLTEDIDALFIESGVLAAEL